MIKLFDDYGVLYVGTSEFVFDIEDLPIIQSRNWYKDKDGYLASSYIYEGRRCFTMFHRIIMHAEPQQCVDHINRNRADNRKQNLRCCSRAENNRNRGRSAANKSGITGVYYDKYRHKWIANIIHNKKRLFIGRFDTKEAAAKARIEKEMELFKEFAPQRLLYEELNCKDVTI